MHAMTLKRRHTWLAMAAFLLFVLGLIFLLQISGLLVRNVDMPIAAREDVGVPMAQNTRITACLPSSADTAQTAPSPQRSYGRSFEMLDVVDDISIGGCLTATRTDANGNPVLGVTYVLSVAYAFALGDSPI